MIRQFANRLALTVAPAALVMAVAKPAMAFWLGFFSGAATVGAAAVTDGLAIAAGVAQVGGVGTHCVTGGDDFKPSFVNSASAGALTCSATMLSTTYPTFPLPGNSLDPLYTAVNDMISALNTMDADAQANASAATLLNDAHNVGTTTTAIAAESSALFGPADLTSSEFNATAAQIGIS